MIEIIDDFLTPSYFTQLSRMVCSDHFPWYFRGNVTREDRKNSIMFPSGQEEKRLAVIGFDFSLFRMDTQLGIRDDYEVQASFPMLYHILDRTGYDDILRARYDLTTYQPGNFMHDAHIDLNHPDFKSCILYMNETDGQTVIFDEKVWNTADVDITKNYNIKEKIDPKPNRLVIFDGHYIHTGHSPSENKSRILMNAVMGKRFEFDKLTEEQKQSIPRI
jgi:hypothetical protein